MERSGRMRDLSSVVETRSFGSAVIACVLEGGANEVVLAPATVPCVDAVVSTVSCVAVVSVESFLVGVEKASS